MFRSAKAVMEGVVFGDGKIATRWLVPPRSGQTWDSYQDFALIHVLAHPDYDTEVVWHDGR